MTTTKEFRCHDTDACVVNRNKLPVAVAALEELRRRNLLGYSEKTGYKLQSSAAEEWERERRELGVPTEVISEVVQKLNPGQSAVVSTQIKSLDNSCFEMVEFRNHRPKRSIYESIAREKQES